MAKDTSGRKNRTLLVCGIPGSGKTTYCRWLAQQKGFDHLDFDELLSGRVLQHILV
jgi:shikimate kinase